MAENPDFLLLETLFSPSTRAASGVPPASSPMPAQATTYTFNSPLLPTLNKDNVLMFGGDAGAASPGPAQPSPAEDDEEPKETSNSREKKGQSGARTAPALACCPAECRLLAGHLTTLGWLGRLSTAVSYAIYQYTHIGHASYAS